MKLEVESYIEKKGDQDVDKMDLSNFGQIKCHNCGKFGHLKKDCRAPRGGAHNLAGGSSSSKGKPGLNFSQKG